MLAKWGDFLCASKTWVHCEQASSSWWSTWFNGDQHAFLKRDPVWKFNMHTLKEFLATIEEKDIPVPEPSICSQSNQLNLIFWVLEISDPRKCFIPEILEIQGNANPWNFVINSGHLINLPPSLHRFTPTFLCQKCSSQTVQPLASQQALETWAEVSLGVVLMAKAIPAAKKKQKETFLNPNNRCSGSRGGFFLPTVALFSSIWPKLLKLERTFLVTTRKDWRPCTLQPCKTHGYSSVYSSHRTFRPANPSGFTGKTARGQWEGQHGLE